MGRSARRKEHAMTRKTMIAAVVAAAFFTGLAVSDGFARGGGHGGGFAGHGSGGFGGAHPGGGFSGSGIKRGEAKPCVNPELMAYPLTQTPPHPVLNHSVTPVAPCPS